MYEIFFNLKKKPFDLLPNPEFIFMSKSHKRALTYLDYGIKERAGFILLTGEVGSGKTTIIRDLIKKQNERVVLAKIFNTKVNSDQLVSMINDDFGLPVQGKDKIELLRDLNTFLIEQYAIGNQPTLIIDEAQNLDSTLLEEVRMLSNLETDSAKLLQIILVGQPELRKTLGEPGMLQLRQRISINCHLQPLSSTEIEDYIHHRLEIAGERTAVVFDVEALDIIYKYSRGIPRLINIICDFLMLSAFAEGTKHLDGEMVLDIIGDLDFENQYWEMKQGEDNRFHQQAEDSNIIGNNLTPMLKDVTARLGALEKESSIISQEMLADIGKKISSVQRDIKGYREETDRLICELKNKIDEVNCKPQQDNLQEEDESSHKGSLLRRDPWGIEIQKRPNQK
jgi:putative secretion ATPase (PEP-CTERM system associated)